MKLLTVLLLAIPLYCTAQSADASFHMASNQYIHKKLQEAQATVDQALKRYPNDEKLNALREKLKKEEEQNEQNKDEENKDEKNKDQQNKDEQKKDQQSKDQKQEQQQKDQEQKDQQQKEKQQQQKANEESQKKEKQDEDLNLDKDKLEQMKMSEEKARMVLEAMRNQEKQYLQQQRRKTTKPRDSNKPDW